MKSFLRLLTPLLLLSAASVAQPPPSATFRPSLLQSYDVEYAYSAPSDASKDPALGEVSVHHFQTSFSGRAPVAEGLMFVYGAALEVNALDADEGLPLPDRLGEVTLNLGLTRKFSDAWNGALFLRPGMYGDFEDFSSDTFNVPALLMANYTYSETLRWTLGLAANPFSEQVVLPALGVNWQFRPAWTLEVGFPRAAVSWKKNEQLTLRAGLSAQGGSYRLTENLGIPPGRSERLANTYVSYREIRVGVGAIWKLAEKISLTAEAGLTTDRRFEYYDRDYTLNGDAAPFFSLGVNGRF